jgi:hypothetical protein
MNEVGGEEEVGESDFAHLRFAPKAEFTAEIAEDAEIFAEDDVFSRISHSYLYSVHA